MCSFSILLADVTDSDGQWILTASGSFYVQEVYIDTVRLAILIILIFVSPYNLISFVFS